MLAAEGRESCTADAFAQRWDDLHQQAAQLAALADLACEAPQPDLVDFPARLHLARPWQRELAWQGLEDIDAMMRPGLAALRVIVARGRDATAPALALWREFHAAREAVMGLFAHTPAEDALNPA
jgi:hypothetical protein